MHERPGSSNEEVWRAILLGLDPRYARVRARLKHVPSPPRCKMCAAPFAGIGWPLMRLLGRAPWSKNPKYCSNCFDVLSRMHGGAEIETSLLFADVRGSTTLAEGISPTEFRTRLDRFYDVASRVIVELDGIVDKFVGDEVMAVFIPALAGERHAERAIDAGRSLLRSMGADGSGLPIGVGIASGVAFVGAVGEPPVTELTALGDVVNTAARLASAAAAGELLVTEETAAAAGVETAGLAPRAHE
ncbi:MAG TPA: adenylate/guanylate cyclase domain-containing protein, partial [Candidatus Dormibacteraeota bacterium]|nr:adenylate/guanylate cyclase domain-containing protein [Candidatus Dormibacteraeota bacterium]